jgi:hypothetical protein
MRFFVAVALALCLACPQRASRATEVSACDSAAAREKALFASVDERLEIFLVDGRKIYFPTLEPPRATRAEPDRPKRVAAELASLLAGRTLVLVRLGEADRWGRIPARLFVEGETESVDESLAAGGLAMASGNSASGESGLCGKTVLEAEAAAREGRLGIWADPDLAVVSVDDGAQLAARAGFLTLVEGRVASIGHTAPRLYLNFGAGRGGFSVTIARRLKPLFERAGFTEKNLLHQTIRVRGVVEIGAAPQIELFHPDQIEFMEGRR